MQLLSQKERCNIAHSERCNCSVRKKGAIVESERKVQLFSWKENRNCLVGNKVQLISQKERLEKRWNCSVRQKGWKERWNCPIRKNSAIVQSEKGATVQSKKGATVQSERKVQLFSQKEKCIVQLQLRYNCSVKTKVAIVQSGRKVKLFSWKENSSYSVGNTVQLIIQKKVQRSSQKGATVQSKRKVQLFSLKERCNC